MRTALVTGVAGLIGSHMANHLLDEGWRVIGVDDLSGGYRSWLPATPNFRFIRLNLNSFSRFQHLVGRTCPEVIFHFAAYAAEGLSPFVRRLNYERNLLATASVINSAVQYQVKIVFSSSMAVYGRQPPPFTEDMPRRPIDPYGIAKASAELDLEATHEQFGLRYTIVRPHNVIGTRQNIWDRYRNVAGIFIRRGITGQPLQIFGSGEQKRAFSDVRSYLKPLQMLADTGDGEIFNMGSDRATEVKELALLVRDLLRTHGVRASIEHVEARHEVEDAFCSHDKAKQELGFSDDTDLAEVIDEMIRWALTEPERPIKRLKYEVTRNLYSFWR